MTKVLYLAGPMSGLSDFNRPAFDHAALWLRRAGYEVVNPAELDHSYPDLDDPDLADPGTFTAEHYRRAMLQGIRAIVGREACAPEPEEPPVDGLAYLDGWVNSRGAKAEVLVAQAIGVRVDHWERWFGDAFANVPRKLVMGPLTSARQGAS